MILAFGVSNELIFAVIFNIKDVRRSATSPVEGLHISPVFPAGLFHQRIPFP